MLPLALGAAVNTRVLATESTLLTGSTRPLFVATLFGTGAAAPLLLIGLIDLVSVRLTVSAVSDERALYASSVADVVVGALLLLAAAWLARSSAQRSGANAAGVVEPPAARIGRRRTFLRGVVTMATDLSTMAMFVTASKDVAVSHLGILVESLLFLMVLAITAVTAWLPPLLFLLDQELARRLLGPMGRQVHRHGRTIAEVLLLVFGVYLLSRGVLGVV